MKHNYCHFTLQKQKVYTGRFILTDHERNRKVSGRNRTCKLIAPANHRLPLYTILLTLHLQILSMGWNRLREFMYGLHSWLHCTYEHQLLTWWCISTHRKIGHSMMGPLEKCHVWKDQEVSFDARRQRIISFCHCSCSLVCVCWLTHPL